MTGKGYEALNRYMKAHGKFCNLIRAAERALTVIVFASYPIFLAWSFVHQPQVLAKVILVPLGSFLAVSAVRYFLNRPRPYEAYEVAPLIKKDTVGKSFPSRHVFSVFMLAETYLYAASDAVAFPFYVMGLILAVCRVLLGVHFIKDVVAGAVVALLCGLVYYL